MFKVDRIRSSKDVYFQECWDCYVSSFPEEERRPLADHVRALADESFHMLRYADAAGFAAIFFYWQGRDYVYGEHLAIAPSRRGKGLGSRLMQHFLQGLQLPLVLEIEPLVDAQTQARYRFYQALGFHLLTDKHLQLAYSNASSVIPLLLLSYPQALSHGAVAAFQSWLQGDIARYNQGAAAGA